MRRRLSSPYSRFLGTNLDNVQDMMSKGRSGYQRYPERYRTSLLRQIHREYMRKLTDEQVIELRVSTDDFSKLAQRFSVSEVAIRNIRRGRTYAHLPSATRFPVMKRGPRSGHSRYAPEDCVRRRSPKHKHPVTCICKLGSPE